MSAACKPARVAVVLGGTEQRTLGILPVPGGMEVLLDPGQGGGMSGHEADLAALAVDAQVLDPAPVFQVPDPERTQLGPAQPVVKQHRQNRPVPFALEGVRRRRVEQRPAPARHRWPGVLPSLVSLDGRFTPTQRIEGHGVALTKVVEQAGQRRQLPANGGRRVAATLQLLAPGEGVGTGH